MELHVSIVGGRPLAEQICDQVRARIRGGQLRPGQPLPSSRELAVRLGVSRNTVVAAYDALLADGLVAARVGVGVFVRDASTAPAPAASPPAAVLRPQPIWDSIPAREDLSAVRPAFDFRSGIPSAQHFPYATWRGLLSRQVRLSAVPTSAYAGPAGVPALRAAIARHVTVSRGVRAAAEDVFVTNGAQQALDLLARVLLAPGDVVAVEDPGYGLPTLLFRSLRLRVVGVPVDGDGLVVSAIPPEARLVYVTPSHQFPLGMTMSDERRRDLLRWADRSGAVVVEDDYDSEFRYSGRPLNPLQSIDGSRRVLYVGSFSKALLPTLRLGFLLAPQSLMPALDKAKALADWHTPAPLQEALARFIDEGGFARHLRRMRRVYEQRHQMIVSSLDATFTGQLDRIPSGAGLHVTALLQPSVGLSDEEVARHARRCGVEVGPVLSRYAVTNPPRSGLVLGYGAIPTDRIPEGLQRLRRCLGPADRSERDGR